MFEDFRVGFKIKHSKRKRQLRFSAAFENLTALLFGDLRSYPLTIL